MTSIKGIDNCFGCGLCAITCSRKAIKIELNSNGFYSPIVNNKLCNDCSLCREVCAFLDDKVAINHGVEVKGYAAWSNDRTIRMICSSGGVSYELGRHLLSEGYKVCSVKYDSHQNKAVHYIATNEEELLSSVGSKYIQSYTVDGFRSINKKEKYLVTGTPCQIDSFRRYIRKFKVEENFILMDFFCHAVPSMYAWNKYLKLIENNTGIVESASWRNKDTGWHDSWAIRVKGKNGEYNSRFSQGDIFYKLFLGDFCCNPACQKDCRFKYDKSSADIRIGDLWGKTYKTVDEGVSAVVSFTKKGDDIVNKLNCTIIPHPFEVVAEGQMKRNAGKHFLSPIVSIWLSSRRNYKIVIWVILFIDWLWRFPKRACNKIKRIITK